MNKRQPEIAILMGMHPPMLVCFASGLDNQQIFEGFIKKLNDIITITDVCEIGKISIGSIEGGPIENKITDMSHCVGD